MMIGILSDIHGQLDALNQALELFNHLHIQMMICAGDLVDRGPDGDKAVDIIRKMNIPVCKAIMMHEPDKRRNSLPDIPMMACLSTRSGQTPWTSSVIYRLNNVLTGWEFVFT